MLLPAGQSKTNEQLGHPGQMPINAALGMHACYILHIHMLRGVTQVHGSGQQV